MRLARLFIFLFGIGIVSEPAFAQDDDFLLDEDPDEDDDIGVPAPVDRIDEGDVPQGDEDDTSLDDEENELDALMGEGEAPLQIDLGLDVDDDEESDEELPPGTDNAAIYRAQIEQMVGMQPDEEGMAWESYLQTYPYSVFRKQIEARMDELGEAMFRGPRGAVADVKSGSTKRKELDFTAGMLIEPIDPRSRLRAGFEWGYPSWINLITQYEHQLQRDFSVHAGLSHRYTGWTLAAGTRYAIIQSTRTDFILTAIGDLQMNLAPVAPGVRPMIAAGKRFRFGSDSFFDIQAQTGSDLMFYPGIFSPRWISGLNMTLSPSERVQVFFELTGIMKDMGSWNERTGSFKFNQMAFGLRFQGKGKSVVGTGATVPFTTNYWRHHYGAIMADYQYYL